MNCELRARGRAVQLGHRRHAHRPPDRGLEHRSPAAIARRARPSARRSSRAGRRRSGAARGERGQSVRRFPALGAAAEHRASTGGEAPEVLRPEALTARASPRTSLTRCAGPPADSCRQCSTCGSAACSGRAGRRTRRRAHLGPCGRQMPFAASVVQPVPLPSARVPAPPLSAPGRGLAAAFCRLSSRW